MNISNLPFIIGNSACCWAFTTVAAVESLNYIKSGQLVELSEQQVLDCDVDDMGCEGHGNLDRAFTYIKSSPGIATYDSYPYTAVKGGCKAPSGGVKIDGFEDVPTGDEDALKHAVAQQPVSVGIDGAGFEFKNYKSGTFDGPCTADINHAVTIIGYGIDTNYKDGNYWLIKNSWGTGWGEGGYMRMARDKNLCSIGAMASYPV